MNIQEDEKKPVYEIHESVSITKQHFEWLNHEVLRIGHLARQYSDQGDLLRAELKLLRHERVHDLNHIGSQQEEIADLKAEVDALMTNPTSRLLRAEREENARLNNYIERLEVRNAELVPENARLKAEVESLKKPAVIGGYNISEYIRMANSETLEFDNGDIFADMTLPERIKYIVESHSSLGVRIVVMGERLTALVESNLNSSKVAMGKADAVLHERDSLKAEVERLKAVSIIEQRTIQGLQQTPEWSEITRLTADYRKLEADLRNCRTAIVVKDAEKERLKAEVERLKNTDPNSITGSTIMSDPAWSIACFRFHRENERAEIARLRKAGDNLERVLTTKVASYEVANASHEWRAAKEGKPSV